MEEEEKTTRHKQLTNGMINAAFDAIFQIDSKGIIQMVNQAAIDHFGFSREEFLGSNIVSIELDLLDWGDGLSQHLVLCLHSPFSRP